MGILNQNIPEVKLAENSPYFNAIVAARAMTFDEDEYLLDHTISLETQSDLMGESIYAYVWNNFNDFITKIRNLSEEDQELLLSYYILGKTQTSLAIVNKSTQTICSSKIRMAVKRLGAHVLLGEITESVLDDLLSRTDYMFYEKDSSIKMSQLILLYSQVNSFQDVADALGLYRPDVRRSITNLSKALLVTDDLKLTALGAYVHGLIERSAIRGFGPSKTRVISRGHMYRRDPDILGCFDINLSDPDFADVLYPRANQ
jgi:hypothetical protein